jgi:hypothetical protein
MKFINFFFYVCGSFLPSWNLNRIANPDPDTDPGTPLNPDPIQIRIADPETNPGTLLIKSGYYPDPDTDPDP